VRQRGWLTQQEFLDYFSATNFIPGPNSTEMAIHIGHRRAGWPGLIVAGTCFILPAAIIVTAIGWAYVKFGKLPEAAGLLYGIKPVVIAIILQALWKLGRAAIKNRWLAFIAIVAVFLSAVRVNELLILVIGGIAAFPWRKLTFEKLTKHGGDVVAWMPIYGGVGAAAGGMSVGLWPMFLIFAKIGSVLFGSGYVLLAFLRADLVERYHWLTQQQLLDAVAVGQLTPGPLFTTATFIGYILQGPSGALVATLANEVNTPPATIIHHPVKFRS
jgi:chromate transporter